MKDNPTSAHAEPSDRAALALERHGIAYVEPGRRYGRPRNQFTVRFAPVIYLAGIFVGSSGAVLGLGFWGSVTAIVMGNLLGSVGTGLCAAMGPRLGMPQLPMGRAAFGHVGNYLPALLSLLVFVGYYTVGTVLGAQSLADLFKTPYEPTVVVVAALNIVIGVYGYRILHILGDWITKLSFVLLTVVSIVLIAHGGGPGMQPSTSGSDYWLAWLVMFTVVFGYTASWAPYASDYSRYLPENTKPSSVVKAATAGLFASTTWMMVLGAGLITLAPDGDVLGALEVALPDWLRYVVLLTLGISAIPHNAVNLYSGAMATLTCDLRLPQWVTVTIAGLFGLFLALVFGGAEFQANFRLFLHVVSYYITPWLAVLLIDYFVVHRSGRGYPDIRNFYERDGVFGRYGIPGLTALVVGTAISIPFMGTEFYTGPVAKALHGADFSYFVSAVVAAVIYAAWRPRVALPAGIGVRRVEVDRA
ncbi:purine-cytosine permease family protein [Streptomyces sp. NPDC058066]|uniref:purine-cytosine permease family protein n=1 Tax=Streptomyces sp. NPDC058066 TaxID=3346323 RepID=UPI0036E90442